MSSQPHLGCITKTQFSLITTLCICSTEVRDWYESVDVKVIAVCGYKLSVYFAVVAIHKGWLWPVLRHGRIYHAVCFDLHVDVLANSTEFVGGLILKATSAALTRLARA